MKKSILPLLLMLFPQMATPENVEIEGVIYNVDMLEETASVVGWNNTSEMVNVPDYIAYEGMIYPVVQIKEWAFGNLEKMESIEIGNNIQEIGEKAFWGCVNLTSVKLPDNLTVINKNLFYGCRKLREIKIPKSVERIDSYAFNGCSSLQNIVLPDKLWSIEDYAFAWCSSLPTFVVPESLQMVGKYAFLGCKGLKGIYITNLDKWCKIYFYNTDSNPLCYAKHLYLNDKEIKELTIPQSITSISSNVFNGFTEMVIVNLPESIKWIYENAFMGCNGLQKVNISNLEKWLYIEFKNENANPLSSGHDLYINNEEVTTLTIPNCIEEIGKYVLEGCHNIKTIYLHDKIKYIADHAFANCKGITDVFCYAENVPRGQSFLDGTPIEFATLHVPAGSIEDYKDIYPWCNFKEIISLDESIVFFKQEGIQYSYKQGNSVEVVGSDGLIESIPESVKYNGTDYCVTSIGEYAFHQNGLITSLSIPNTITTIGASAFKESSLTSIKLPIELSSIDASVFENCTSLKSIIIPNSVKSIASNAFKNCYSLKHIYIYSNNVPNTNESAFDGAWINNATLHVPYESVETYGKAEPWRDFKNIVAIKIIGDANGDGIVDTKDIIAVTDYIMKGETDNGFNFVNADTNSDAKVNIVDIVAITNIIMNK